jgi:ribosome-associated translation inhibitor RaiA
LEKSKMTVLHTEKFAGDVLECVRHGPDVVIRVNGKEFGVYTSIEAALNAAKDSIIRQLERG